MTINTDLKHPETIEANKNPKQPESAAHPNAHPLHVPPQVGLTAFGARPADLPARPSTPVHRDDVFEGATPVVGQPRMLGDLADLS